MISYSIPIKNARLGIVRDALNGGRLEILSDIGSRIASIELEKVSGSVLIGSLVFSGFPKFAMAETGGKASAARLVSAGGEITASGLTLGLSGADVIMENIEIDAANVVRIDRAEIRHA